MKEAITSPITETHQAETGDQHEDCGRVVGQVDEAVIRAGGSPLKSGVTEMSLKMRVNYCSPLPAMPALTAGRGLTSWRQAGTWSQRRSSS